MKDTLIAITTYKQTEYTIKLLESIKNLDEDFFDVCIIDNSPDDDTKDIAQKYGVTYYKNPDGEHLTYSINRAYSIFKNSNYTYLAVSNNDVLIPKGALTELKDALDFIPSSLVAPLSTERGCGHNKLQSISRIYTDINDGLLTDINYQEIQDMLISVRYDLHSKKELHRLDPVRMKMFNGFFFMLHKRVERVEREDGNIFDPTFKNVKNEDEFNWKQLLPNNDYPLLCKTAFIYHYKGVTCTDLNLRF